jgi:hypothetical protein
MWKPAYLFESGALDRLRSIDAVFRGTVGTLNDASSRARLRNMGLDLKQEFSYWVALNPPVDFGVGPFGFRRYLEVTDGRATGERFNATAVGGGGDWILVGPDGYARVDVRLQFKTDDGANVYVQYFGLLEANEAVLGAMTSGGGTTYVDQYFRTTPRLETGDERYAWMNTSVFVARGRVREGSGVEYEVYRVL